MFKQFQFVTSNVLNNLLTMYDKVMVLKVYVDSNDNDLKNKYVTNANGHNNKIINNPATIDAGFDLLTPTPIPFFCKNINKLDLNIICSAKIYTDKGKTYNTGYYMYPRSSVSKTPLRLANSTGIIDSGYRGHLMGMFDVLNTQTQTKTQTKRQINNNQDTDPDPDPDFVGQQFDRFLQICAPGLVPILVEVVDDIDELGEETERGAGGFGSTGR